MAKSIIIVPRSPFLTSDRVMPTLGPLYLKSFLESEGHEIYVEDNLQLDRLDPLQNFDIVGISTTTPQYYAREGARDIAQKIREKFPKKKIVIGGAHAKNYFQETLEDRLFDHIIGGDGEFAYLSILEGQKLPLIFSCPQLSGEEMNSFPLPWRNKEYLMKYDYRINGRDSSTAMTSRYCAMRCKFCEERDSKLRLYELARIDKELDQLKKMGFGGLMFYDDILPISKKRTEDLCKIITPHDLIFRCNGYVKTMNHDPEILDMMASAGCVEVCLGIESGDQTILNTIEKRTLVSEIHGATRNILDRNMRVSAYIIIGLPGESYSTIRNTEKYLEEFSNDPNFSFDLTIYYPYRYTYIREHLNEFDLKIHLEGSTGLYKGKDGKSECCVSTSFLSREDIVKERERILEKYSSSFRGAKPIHT